MAPRKTATIPFPVRVPASFVVDLTKFAAQLTDAEKMPRDAKDAARSLLAFALSVVQKCPACSAGIVCALHGTVATTALRPQDAPPDASPPSSKEGAAGGAYGRTVDLYFVEFEAARGEGPTFDAADGAAVLRMLEKIGEATTARAIRGAYANKLFREHATIRSIARDPSRHLGDSSANGTSTLQADSGFGLTKGKRQ